MVIGAKVGMSSKHLGTGLGPRLVEIIFSSAATTCSLPMPSQTERDLPAFVDFILANTGHERLAYIGHSQVISKDIVRHILVYTTSRNFIHKTPATIASIAPPLAREPRK